MKSKKIAYYGLCIALAFVLSYVESLFPTFIAVPGVKLGLTNLVVLIALVKISKKDAFFINMIRILLVGLTFGTAFSLLYSFAGGILSFLVMMLFYGKNRFSVIGVSVAGGVAHNVGQILVAMMALESKALVYYLPVLILSGTLAGVVVGILCGEVVKRLPNHSS